jgi:hypothetical protein
MQTEGTLFIEMEGIGYKTLGPRGHLTMHRALACTHVLQQMHGKKNLLPKIWLPDKKTKNYKRNEKMNHNMTG